MRRWLLSNLQMSLYSGSTLTDLSNLIATKSTARTTPFQVLLHHGLLRICSGHHGGHGNRVQFGHGQPLRQHIPSGTQLALQLGRLHTSVVSRHISFVVVQSDKSTGLSYASKTQNYKYKNKNTKWRKDKQYDSRHINTIYTCIISYNVRTRGSFCTILEITPRTQRNLRIKPQKLNYVKCLSGRHTSCSLARQA